ncbi:hypothetical protein ATCC90586_001054 [Pythium insidiosum]|nr:hypothetical protein ATCC90586_001054 [Pythium insidiosum]
MQSFLGSLNYYGKFIEGYASIASVLYELTDEQLRGGHDLEKAKLAFQLLKDRLLAAPILRHPNRDRPFVVILHANDWAVGAVLAQEYEGILHPVRFTSRTLHDAELRYHIAEKEVLALLRVLSTFYTIVAGSPVKVYTRYSVLKWLLTSKTVTGRCLQWATLLSPWTLEIQRIEKDEDQLASLLAGSITPREVLDRLTSELEPAKSRKAGTPVVSIEMLDAEYEGHVITFDGAAKLKTKVGSASYVLWSLPGWLPVEGRSFQLSGVTVNEAEYEGLLRGLARAGELGIKRVVLVGDSRIAVQQCQGAIRCHESRLQVLLNRFQALERQFELVKLVHVKREYNAPADYLASRALQAGDTYIGDDEGRAQLSALNKLPERIMRPAPTINRLKKQRCRANMTATALLQTHRASSRARASSKRTKRLHEPARDQHEPAQGNGDERPAETVTEERWRRVKRHQENDPACVKIISFLRGDLARLTRHEARDVAKLADCYALDDNGLLRFIGSLNRRTSNSARLNVARLVIPASLHKDMLHAAHDDFQGGHQGVARTFDRLRREFYWHNMYRDVERYVKECVDCSTAKGRPGNPGPSPGNLMPEYPFQVISMDFVTPLPASRQGNTSQLLFQDSFTGFVLAKAMQDTSALAVAQTYDSTVFQRFGASSVVRHDRDPRFMSEVFAQFRMMIGAKQRATLAYRPQANGQQERISPWVHVSRLKPRILNEDRPSPAEEAELPEEDDWDASLLPEDSWEADNQAGFDASRKAQNRFASMQTGDEQES